MLVREAKLLKGILGQYLALDEAIRTAQFVLNKYVRPWMDNRGVGKPALSVLSKDLAKEFERTKKLSSSACQASAERALASISNFYTRCRKGEKKKGYPTFKKHCRSVEYRQSGWKLSEDCKRITCTDGFKTGTFSVFCNGEARADLFRLKINRDCSL